MNNKVLLVCTIVIIVLVSLFVMSGSGGSNNSSGGTVAQNGNVQKVSLSIKNGNYYPGTITVKADELVSLSLDSSVSGCYRSFTIRDLGVQGYSSSPSQTIDFTPTKKGTFRFACSMGMGYGTIVVE